MQVTQPASFSRLMEKLNLKPGQNVNNHLGEAGALCLEKHGPKLKDE